MEVIGEMRIALVIDSMSPGGSERTVQILANILSSAGYEVGIFSLANLWHYTLDPKVCRFSIYERNFSFARKMFVLPMTYRRLRRLIYCFDPIVVLSFTPQANILNALLSGNSRFKTISSERHYARDYYGNKNIIARPIIKWMHNKVDAIIVNDIIIGNSLESYYGVKKPIYVLNNLFDGALLELDPVASEEKNEKCFKYITIGRLSLEKNTKDLLLAMSMLDDNDSVLEIIGDGPLRANLVGLTHALGLHDRVLFRGHQKNPFQFLKQADAFVFSSLNEGFPNVVLEAMACHLPIISYHFKSGINTILEGGKNGILIRLGDVGALSKAMEDIKNNAELRNYYVEQSKSTVARFSDKDAYLHKLKNIIKYVLEIN